MIIKKRKDIKNVILSFLVIIPLFGHCQESSIPCKREENDKKLTCKEYVILLDLAWTRKLNIDELKKQIAELKKQLELNNVKPINSIVNYNEISNTLSKNLKYNEKSYTIYVVNPKKKKINLYNKINFEQFHDFSSIHNSLQSKNKKLLFAMNAGMYERDKTPIGLYIVNGFEIHPLNLKKRSPQPSNFYNLQPNGVFVINTKNEAYIVPSKDYKNLKKKGKIILATQSGPMMVINNKINTYFNEGSKNVNIRNGIGITSSGKIIFVISNEPVNFYEFSQFFRGILKCSNALYLDGVVSRIFLPELGKTNLNNSNHLGPIITVEE